MLNKRREDIYDEIKRKIDNDLNYVQDMYAVSVDNDEHYGSMWTDGLNSSMSLPGESIGWPPGLAKYIRRLALMMTKEILDNTMEVEDYERMRLEKLRDVFYKLGVNGI